MPASARLLIGHVAARSGLSRKALRLYESAGILPPAARTPAGYRTYGEDTLGLLAFVTQARRLGFSLGEIGDIVKIRRAGRAPCPHVRALVHRKAVEIDRTLVDLAAMRRHLRALLASWPVHRGRPAAVCPHIERSNGARRKR